MLPSCLHFDTCEMMALFGLSALWPAVLVSRGREGQDPYMVTGVSRCRVLVTPRCDYGEQRDHFMSININLWQRNEGLQSKIDKLRLLS